MPRTLFFIISSMANAHGVERTLTDKINYLASRGHKVVLVTYEQGSHPNAFDIDERVEQIDLECRYFLLYRFPLIVRLYKAWNMKRLFGRKLGQLMEEKRPDAIVVTTYSGEFMHSVMTFHHQTRIIVEAHTAFSHDMVGVGLVDRLQKRHVLHYLKKCHLLVALTKADADSWRKYVHRVESISNPLPFYADELDLSRRVGGRIIAVGRYYPQKRFDRLIDAFALIASKYPLWHVNIYGEGPDELQLQAQIDRLGLHDRIRLCPATSDIRSEYIKSQMLVMSSDYEGFGLVLIEAMACGVPPIATDCPHGPAEIIEDGVTGLLAEMDVQDLADKMEWMITHEDERMTMGVNAHLAVAKYSQDRLLKKWEQIYTC